MESREMNAIQNQPARVINKCVRMHVDGVFLLGDLQIPEESTALVIFAYGSGRSRNNPRSLHTARVIREKGIGTLLCDLLTEEEEMDDEASENFRNDAALLARRLIAVTQWVANDPDTCDLRIGYFGACAGGASVLLAAASMPDHVAAVVCRGGRMDLATTSLPRVTCPTLMIVGENDVEGLTTNRDALSHLTCKKELKVVSGASHLFGEPCKLEEMARLSADWFCQHLKAPPLRT